MEVLSSLINSSSKTLAHEAEQKLLRMLRYEMLPLRSVIAFLAHEYGMLLDASTLSLRMDSAAYVAALSIATFIARSLLRAST